MKKFGLTMVQARPEARMYSSTAQWARGMGVSAVATASIEDIFTRCFTPAATHRSVNCFSFASCCSPFGNSRKAFSTPARARFTVSASAISPTTSSTPAAFRSAGLGCIAHQGAQFRALGNQLPRSFTTDLAGDTRQ